MLIDANELDRDEVAAADICILGGGVAGIVLAKELAPYFPSLVVLESGGKLLTQLSRSDAEPDIVPSGYPDPTFSRLRVLGGTSNHWQNSTEKLDPIDFEERPWVRNSGWPIGYSDIEPYYDPAATYCGVIDDNFDPEYWSALLNIADPMRESAMLSTSIVKAAFPPTRFYEKYGGDLESSTELRVYTHATVSDLDYDAETGSIKSATFQNDKSKKYRIFATSFVMALGGIENARLLLAFNRRYGGKLGNASGKVGRYFMDHPTIRAAVLYPNTAANLEILKSHRYGPVAVNGSVKLSEKAIVQNRTTNMRMFFMSASRLALSEGVDSMHEIGSDLGDFEWPDDFGSHLGNIFSDFGLILDGASRKAFGKDLFDSSNEFGGYQVVAMLEQSPDWANRIRLGESNDRFGMPRVIVDYKVGEPEKRMAWKSLEVLAHEIGAHDLGRVQIRRLNEERIWGSQLGFGHHHIGTTRMGRSEDDGVVDLNLRLFGTKNLFVTGSSVFCTGGHVPPTLTIVALTIRLAQYLRRSHKQ